MLSDDDDTAGHTSPPLQDLSAEIGNTQNQLNSTNRALDTLKSERTQSDERLAGQKSQLESLQAQLATAKAAFESETKTLASIRERYSAQIADIQKLREELIHAESDLSAIRVEKADVEQVYLRDKEDTRELQRKMTEVSQVIEVTKVEVEKAKKEAKQQKGLLAIAKKQLSAKEAEKAKADKELEEAVAEVIAITKERTDAEAELAAFNSVQVPARVDSTTFAANHPLPSSPDRNSPAPSAVAGKSNNPFDKLQKSGGTAYAQSPFLPLAAGSLPAPSTGDTESTTNFTNRASTFDPFGFSAAFEVDDATPNRAVPPLDPHLTASGASTPKLAPVDVDERTPVIPQSIISPGAEGESDHFVTPPTTATPTRSLTSSPVPVKSDINGATKFSILDNVKPESSNPNVQSLSNNTHPDQETDLRSPKELDVIESDSDSEDEVPLANLAGKAKMSPKKSSIPLTEDGVPSFDDIFEVTPSAVEKSSISAPATTHSEPVTVEHSVSAGVSAFDEAMRIIPNSATPKQQTLTFDSAFDDNFDFDSATNKPSSPPTSAILVPKSTADVPTVASQLESSSHSVSVTNDRGMGGPSTASESSPTFDAAFSGFESGPSLALNSSFAVPVSKPATASSAPPFPSPTLATPPQVRPVSPSPPAAASNRSSSPRNLSPKPARTSTSSSKETHEKVKDSSSRHSKLSVCVCVFMFHSTHVLISYTALDSSTLW